MAPIKRRASRSFRPALTSLESIAPVSTLIPGAIGVASSDPTPTLEPATNAGQMPRPRPTSLSWVGKQGRLDDTLTTKFRITRQVAPASLTTQPPDQTVRLRGDAQKQTSGLSATPNEGEEGKVPAASGGNVAQPAVHGGGSTSVPAATGGFTPAASASAQPSAPSVAPSGNGLDAQPATSADPSSPATPAGVRAMTAAPARSAPATGTKLTFAQGAVPESSGGGGGPPTHNLNLDISGGSMQGLDHEYLQATSSQEGLMVSVVGAPAAMIATGDGSPIDYYTWTVTGAYSSYQYDSTDGIYGTPFGEQPGTFVQTFSWCEIPGDYTVTADAHYSDGTDAEAVMEAKIAKPDFVSFTRTFQPNQWQFSLNRRANRNLPQWDQTTYDAQGTLTRFGDTFTGSISTSKLDPADPNMIFYFQQTVDSVNTTLTFKQGSVIGLRIRNQTRPNLPVVDAAPNGNLILDSEDTANGQNPPSGRLFSRPNPPNQPVVQGWVSNPVAPGSMNVAISAGAGNPLKEVRDSPMAPANIKTYGANADPAKDDYMIEVKQDVTFTTFLMAIATDPQGVPGGMPVPIGKLTWSEFGDAVFNDNENGGHTAAFYNNPANWTVQPGVKDPAGPPDQTQQGMATDTLPNYSGNASNIVPVQIK